jgi:hypothetical protein
VGVDHIYVYDNSEAHTNETDLLDITDLYPNQITKIIGPVPSATTIIRPTTIPENDRVNMRPEICTSDGIDCHL